jgi:mannose-1-phosphate guanylyltransferase/mannose-6-phosphate isomerase
VTAQLRSVILSGGSGTRLWPISTPERPKQFGALLGEPLFDATVRRALQIPGSGAITVVVAEDQVTRVEEAATRAGVVFDPVIVEPVGRNTAPAIAAACLLADPEDVLVVLPSDHAIADTAGFLAAVGDAVDLALDGYLVTFGVVPSRPETGYGYIQKGKPIRSGFLVDRFREKPGPEDAEAMVRDGAHLWNSGMFVFKASTMSGEIEHSRPGLLDSVATAIGESRSGTVRLDTGFADVESVSIDQAVMEVTDRAVMVPMDAGWTDVGSWQSLWDVLEKGAAGNALKGDVVIRSVSNSLVVSTSRRVAVAGVDGMAVIETPEAVLVLPLDHSQLVRELAAEPPRAVGD